MSKQEGDFFEFFWPLQKSWTLLIVIWQAFLTAIIYRGLRIFFFFYASFTFSYFYLDFYIPCLFSLLFLFYIWIILLFLLDFFLFSFSIRSWSKNFFFPIFWNTPQTMSSRIAAKFFFWKIEDTQKSFWD